MLRKRIDEFLRTLTNKFGYDFKRIEDKPDCIIDHDFPYFEREEYGASNLQTKIDNLKDGLPFEYPDIINLNEAVVSLIGNAKRIVELGSGTGKFAVKAAQNSSRNIVASEFDQLTYNWCLKNIPSQSNLLFLNGPIPKGIAPFDLSVSIEVVEHISDYVGFLKEMRSLAPRSLITTPNRKRSFNDYHAGPPVYFKHVREWTAGEFYWVLRCFWNDVRLYALISQTEPALIKVNIDTSFSPLIADCRNPL